MTEGNVLLHEGSCEGFRPFDTFIIEHISSLHQQKEFQMPKKREKNEEIMCYFLWDKDKTRKQGGKLGT